MFINMTLPVLLVTFGIFSGDYVMSAAFRSDRVYIVFADRNDPDLKAQARDFRARSAALDERQLIVFAVAGNDGLEPIHGSLPADADAKALRLRYEVPVGSPLTGVLIGKDGSVKWREQRPAEPAELFALIDSMPMRRQEMSR
jgi:hypothetical protein